MRRSPPRAFAFSAYAPPRSLAPIALIAALAAGACSTWRSTAASGVAWASRAWPSVLIGLVSYSVAGRVRVPPLVIVVSSIVPLLPGLSIYRGLYLLSEGGNGLLSMINAAAIAIALAAGVIFGEYVAQPLKREARRLEGRLSGPAPGRPAAGAGRAAASADRPALGVPGQDVGSGVGVLT